jgi:hypothetical protein
MRTAIPLTVLVTGLACSLFTAPAQARARVFVASYGSDSNPCTFGSPCKTFQHAVDIVDPGGEVTAIDSAGFGPISITNKSVTITSPNGVEAGIVIPSGGTGISISAGSTNAVVTLQGLTIDGAGVGAAGISLIGAGSLTIENCVVRNQTSYGIALAPTLTASQISNILISHTLVTNNGIHGIYVQPTGSGDVTAVFNHVEAVNNAQTGIGVYGNLSTGKVFANVTDSVSASNGGDGFVALTTSGNSFTGMFLLRSLTTRNGNNGALVDGSGALIYASQTMMTFNSVGFEARNNGLAFSYQDNTIDGNQGNVSPTPQAVAKQ